MFRYNPIDKPAAPLLQDKIVSISKEEFKAAPILSFLSSYEETITVSSTHYNPLVPSLSATSPVVYRINRTYTTLSDKVVSLRHNQDSIDMEVYVDQYNLIQANPIVKEYSPNPILPKIVRGDRYERNTVCYIFANIESPRASSKVWDGRYGYCVDLNGIEIDSSSRLIKLREGIKELLSSNLTPYSVVSTAGFANTVNPPQVDPYEATYRLRIEEFIAANYNSLTLPEPPTTEEEVPEEITVYNNVPQNFIGSGRFRYKSTIVAAMLDGDYFVKYIKVIQFDEVPLIQKLQSSYQVIGQEEDSDDILILEEEEEE